MDKCTEGSLFAFGDVRDACKTSIDHATSMRKQRHKYLHSTFEAAHLSPKSTCGARLHRDTPSPATTKSVIKTQPAFLNAQQVECSRSTRFAGSSNAKALTNSTTASRTFQAGGVQWLFSAQGGGGVRVRADLTQNILLTMEQQFNNAVIVQPSCLALRDLPCTRYCYTTRLRMTKHPQPQKTSGFFCLVCLFASENKQ